MAKLMYKGSKKHSLTDGTKHYLRNYKLDLSQFNIPANFIALKEGITVKAQTAQNIEGEAVATGFYTIIFKVYDRAFIETILNNGGTEIGQPITVIVDNMDSMPILDNYSDDEFIPVMFKELAVLPKNVETKQKINDEFVNIWKLADIKVVATEYKLGVDVDDKK